MEVIYLGSFKKVFRGLFSLWKCSYKVQGDFIFLTFSPSVYNERDNFNQAFWVFVICLMKTAVPLFPLNWLEAHTKWGAESLGRAAAPGAEEGCCPGGWQELCPHMGFPTRGLWRLPSLLPGRREAWPKERARKVPVVSTSHTQLSEAYVDSPTAGKVGKDSVPTTFLKVSS